MKTIWVFIGGTIAILITKEITLVLPLTIYKGMTPETIKKTMDGNNIKIVT